MAITGHDQATIDGAVKEIGNNAFGKVSDAANIDGTSSTYYPYWKTGKFKLIR